MCTQLVLVKQEAAIWQELELCTPTKELKDQMFEILLIISTKEEVFIDYSLVSMSFIA